MLVYVGIREGARERVKQKNGSTVAKSGSGIDLKTVDEQQPMADMIRD